MLAPLSYAAAVARVQAVGSLLRLPVDRLLEAALAHEEVGSAGPGRRRRVWVTDAFDRIAVFGEAPRSARRDGQLPQLDVDPVLVAALPRLAARTGQLFLEAETTGADQRVAVEVHALGRGVLDDDLALLREIAPAGDAAHAALATRAIVLATGGRSAGVSARFEPPSARQWSIHLALAESVTLAAEALGEVAMALGITAPQRNLLAGVHPVLAGRSPAVATLHLGPGVVYPELVVTYHAVAFEPVIRILIGLHPGVDHASRLGSVAGACGAERAAALAIHVRDREPVGLRIGFDLAELAEGARRE